MPPDTVYVGRPTKWGNPYNIADMDEPTPNKRENAVLAYRISMLTVGTEIRRELSGKNLACWCPLDQPCHADVLLEIANQETPEVTP
jgi:hypothetical protein